MNNELTSEMQIKKEKLQALYDELQTTNDPLRKIQIYFEIQILNHFED